MADEVKVMDWMGEVEASGAGEPNHTEDLGQFESHSKREFDHGFSYIGMLKLKHLYATERTENDLVCRLATRLLTRGITACADTALDRARYWVAEKVVTMDDYEDLVMDRPLRNTKDGDRALVFPEPCRPAAPAIEPLPRTDMTEAIEKAFAFLNGDGKVNLQPPPPIDPFAKRETVESLTQRCLKLEHALYTLLNGLASHPRDVWVRQMAYRVLKEVNGGA